MLLLLILTVSVLHCWKFKLDPDDEREAATDVSAERLYFEHCDGLTRFGSVTEFHAVPRGFCRLERDSCESSAHIRCTIFG